MPFSKRVKQTGGPHTPFGVRITFTRALTLNPNVTKSAPNVNDDITVNSPLNNDQQHWLHLNTHTPCLHHPIRLSNVISETSIQCANLKATNGGAKKLSLANSDNKCSSTPSRHRFFSTANCRQWTIWRILRPGESTKRGTTKHRNYSKVIDILRQTDRLDLKRGGLPESYYNIENENNVDNRHQ